MNKQCFPTGGEGEKKASLSYATVCNNLSRQVLTAQQQRRREQNRNRKEQPRPPTVRTRPTDPIRRGKEIRDSVTKPCTTHTHSLSGSNPRYKLQSLPFQGDKQTDPEPRNSPTVCAARVLGCKAVIPFHVMRCEARRRGPGLETSCHQRGTRTLSVS